ncbi:MAG: class I SAM-dependent methyltransferase [Sulfurimonas sp.]|nr:class I SAM-dependent methyltransferase [Sulfurimonas sp.]
MSNKTLDIDDTLLDYIIQTGVKESALQKRVRDETKKLEMGKMQIAPEQGAFMGFIANLLGAKTYLEIGVFTGYSMLGVVGAMGKDAKAVACDLSKEWTDIAKGYWAEAGIETQINLYVDKAQNSLVKLDDNSFDLAFIDADKENYDLYYEECLRLLKPNALLMIDNIFWGGTVANPLKVDEETTAIRRLNEKIMQDKRVQASMLTIGDGLMLVRKL